jgi:hypothetical protein
MTASPDIWDSAYRWDGEQTYGMLERSNPLKKIDLGN